MVHLFRLATVAYTIVTTAETTDGEQANERNTTSHRESARTAASPEGTDFETVTFNANRISSKEHMYIQQTLNTTAHCFILTGTLEWNEINAILCIFDVQDAGFSEEWSASTEDRSRQRQIEVQANIASNQNRPTEYRSVTAPQPHPHPEFEAEERTC